MESLIEKWHNHGVEVNTWYHKLVKDPSITGNQKVIDFFNNYVPVEGIENYHYNHDMGKPYVYTIDENGKYHYPNHCEESAEMYYDLYGEDDWMWMILHDMDFHVARGENIQRVWKLYFAEHLYATAWAELYANCESFGGMDSVSFKIKRKRLIKALK